MKHSLFFPQHRSTLVRTPFARPPAVLSPPHATRLHHHDQGSNLVPTPFAHPTCCSSRSLHPSTTKLNECHVNDRLRTVRASGSVAVPRPPSRAPASPHHDQVITTIAKGVGRRSSVNEDVHGVQPRVIFACMRGTASSPPPPSSPHAKDRQLAPVVDEQSRGKNDEHPPKPCQPTTLKDLGGGPGGGDAGEVEVGG